MSDKKKTMSGHDMLAGFAIPTVLGKCFVLYFGTRYSAEPGEGYGWGLAIAVLFTIAMVLKFLWKYRNYED